MYFSKWQRKACEFGLPALIVFVLFLFFMDENIPWFVWLLAYIVLVLIGRAYLRSLESQITGTPPRDRGRGRSGRK